MRPAHGQTRPSQRPNPRQGQGPQPGGMPGQGFGPNLNSGVDPGFNTQRGPQPPGPMGHAGGLYHDGDPSNNRPGMGAPDNGYGAPRGTQGYGPDATYKMMGGQLTVGNKSGARSWLGSPTLDPNDPKNADALTQLGGSGVLAPLGVGKSGFMSFGYVPGAKQPGEAGYNVSGLGTPYAAEGGARAGWATNAGWDPKGQANTQAWQGMQDAYGRQRPRTRSTTTFGDVRY